MLGSVADDNQFWLQAMGDHAIFIYENLSPVEAKEIKMAGEFITQFNNLLEEAKQEMKAQQIKPFIERAQKAVQEFRRYKLALLKRQLTDNMRLALPTATMNHMVNEAEEYLNVLSLYSDSTVPTFRTIHYHLFWLLGSLGHANFIQSFSSYPFRDIIEKANDFHNRFTILQNKAIEFGGYLRTGLENFEAMDQLNVDAYEQLRLFAEFMVDLQLLIGHKKVVIPLTVLILDHMYREECYYLTQLSKVSDIKAPACDPAFPRKVLMA